MIYTLEEVPTSINSSFLREIIDWGCNRLDFQDIQIEFIFDVYDASGETVIDDDGVYRVRIHPNLNDTHLLRTIFHELTHIHQITRGDMVITDEGKIYWKGERRTFRENYKELPWESEAYSNEKIMFNEFMLCTSAPA